ncbi:hypothetical protein AB0J28_01510 [Streptosporangium canum]|uniref:hypothetical protein n=1 Tax=Streptosporangium canum TaxID=324952 RepID=UPI0034242CBE
MSAELAEALEPIVDPDSRRRQILETTYPGWHIVYLAGPGHWYARRTLPLTGTLRAAGAVESFIRGTYPAFLQALDQQDAIIQSHGGYSP